MIRPSLLLATLVLLFASGAAMAQEDADINQLEADGSPPHRVHIYKAITKMDFEPFGLNALPDKPVIGLFNELKKPGFAPAFRLRANFDAEIAESLVQVH